VWQQKTVVQIQRKWQIVKLAEELTFQKIGEMVWMNKLLISWKFLWKKIPVSMF
jgi:hypothetical protein